VEARSYLICQYFLHRWTNIAWIKLIFSEMPFSLTFGNPTSVFGIDVVTQECCLTRVFRGKVSPEFAQRDKSPNMAILTYWFSMKPQGDCWWSAVVDWVWVCVRVCGCEPHHMCRTQYGSESGSRGFFSQGKGSEEVVWTRSSGFPAIDTIHRKKDKIVVPSCRRFIANISRLFYFFYYLQ
jgi:hypothetical protein